jgi:hypothetical protein
LERLLLLGDRHVAVRAHPIPDVPCAICVRRTRNGSRGHRVRLQAATSLGRSRHLTPCLRVSRRGCCDSRLRLRGRMRHFSLLCSLVVLLINRVLVLGWRPRNLTLCRWGIPRILCRRTSLCRISRIGWRTCDLASRHRRISGRRSLIPGLRIRARPRRIVARHRLLALLKVASRPGVLSRWPLLIRVPRRRTFRRGPGRVILIAALSKRRHGEGHCQHQAGGRHHPDLELRSHPAPEFPILLAPS